MRYDHDVKINGVWYKAGNEVPAFNDAKAPDEQISMNLTTDSEEQTKPKRAVKKKAE